VRARGLLADGNMIDTAAKPSVGAWRRRVLAVLAIFLGTTVFFMMSSPSTPAELQLEAPWSGQMCGNFCGSDWCNGAPLSEWDADEPHCGPLYKGAILSGDGKPSCTDGCCRQHDMCCAPGGTDPSLTKLCNRQLLDCINHCEAVRRSFHFDSEDVCAHIIGTAMDMVAGSWCCGRPCPPQVYVEESKDLVTHQLESVYGSLFHRVSPVMYAVSAMFFTSPEPLIREDETGEGK